MDERQERIRRRAFEIWELESWRGDTPEDHWLRAEREIDEADAAAAMSGSKPAEPAKAPNVHMLEDGTILPASSDEDDKVAPGTVIPNPDANRR